MTDNHETTGEDLWFALAAGTILVFAAALRIHDLNASLFEDEVWVAELVRHGGWHAHSYLTPPLFYCLERFWTAVAGASPAAMRTMPAVFGVAAAAVPLFATTEERVTRLIWSALLAASSPLVFYSARIKQYSLETTVACALIVLLLRARKRGTAGPWLMFFILALVAVTTLYEPIFLLAACGAICIRRPRQVAGFAAIALMFLIAYRGWLAAGPESTRLHGDMVEYFSANGRWITSPRLFIAGTAHWTGQAMNLVRGWWIAVALLVIVWLVRKRDWSLLALACIPPLLIAATSALRIFPYGEVRLMVVCFPALFLLVADALASAARRVPVSLLLLIPFALSTTRYNDTYMHVYDLRALYDFVAVNRGSEPVHANPAEAAPLRFHHPEITPEVIEWSDSAQTTRGWYIGAASQVHGTNRLVVGDTAAALMQ